VLLAVLIGAVQARAGTQSFDLPVQSLADSLQAVANQANLNIVFDPPLVAGRTAPAVKAQSPADALAALLVGSGLTYEFLNEKTVVVSAIEPGVRKIGQDPNHLQDSSRVAQVDQGTSAAVGSAGPNSSANSESSSLQEVVVTAEKREERLADTPVPVSVLNATALTENNVVYVKDFASMVPGLTLTPNTIGVQTLSIRGISNGDFQTPTVGIVVDGVAMGSATGNDGGGVIPDLDPGDLSQVEVLRGPQGVLYGASSMGGLLSFETKAPSTDAVTGNIQSGLSTAAGGDYPGYSLRGSMNVPVTDHLAVRLSGFSREDPGYVSNPLLGLTDTNRSYVEGGMATVQWRPAGWLLARFTGLYQDYRDNGSSLSSDYLGPDKNNYIPGGGLRHQTTQLYALNLTADFGKVTLHSITGYNTSKSDNRADATETLGFLLKSYGPGADAFIYEDDKDFTKFSEELRASVAVNRFLDVNIGGYFTSEHAYYPLGDGVFYGANPQTGQKVFVYYYNASGNVNPYREVAVFESVDVKPLTNFDIQLGARNSFVKYTTGYQVFDGAFLGNVPSVSPASTATASPFTYLVTPRYRLSDDLMFYLRFASGFRPGGSNQAALSDSAVPRQFQPDTTKTYEVGVKGTFLNDSVGLDLSVFRVNWDNMQLLALTADQNRFSYTANDGQSRSQGVEISGDYKSPSGFSASGWFDYTDAVLTQDIPGGALYGLAGDPLPNSAKYSAYLTAQQALRVADGWRFAAGAAVRYQSSRMGLFLNNATPRDVYPAYTQADLHSSLSNDLWTINLYANNVANRRAVISGGQGYFIASERGYISPRIVGVSVLRQF